MAYDYQGNPEAPNYDHREKLKDVITTRLGAGAVEVEITDDQLELAIDMAVENYRAWSGNSKEESFLHMKLFPSESVYVLPTEVEIVRRIYRRGNGVVSGNSSTVDPFSLAYSNTYLLSAVRGSTGGGLLTYDLYHQFDETVARLFGREIIFQWNPVNKKLIIDRDIRGEEDVLLHVYQNVPEPMLFKQQMTYPWLRDWAMSEAMLMLGRNRSKFATLPGPQGTFSMDGNELRQEAMAMQEKLEQQIRNYRDGSMPLSFIIG
ncbi:hypothetical protein EJP02_198 [Escherichia phage EJP2]|nr:hypothetical protein EJP02_198 [Escherichia phage EJP2]